MLGDGTGLDGVGITGGGSATLSGGAAATLYHARINVGGEVDVTSGSGAVMLSLDSIQAVNDLSVRAYSSTLDVNNSLLQSQNGEITLAANGKLTVDNAASPYTTGSGYDIGAGESVYFHSDNGIEILIPSSRPSAAAAATRWRFTIRSTAPGRRK